MMGFMKNQRVVLIRRNDCLPRHDDAPRQNMSDCIEFKGCKDKNGYGIKRFKDKMMKAHRLAWIQVHGPIPKGLIVRHYVCNNPPCINVEHLSLGTHKDNMQDRTKANRQAKGTKIPQAKLNEEKVLEIRKLLKTGLTQSEIAKKFNVNQTIISDIKLNLIWKHV